MTLVTRISRLFKSDIHAVIDRIEDPQTILQQAMREMAEEINNYQNRLKTLKHEHKALQTYTESYHTALTKLVQDLDTCFANDKPKLAKTLIRQKLELERSLKQITQRIEENESAMDALSKTISEQQVRLEALRQKAEIYSEEQKSPLDITPWNPASIVVTAEDIEIAFLNEQHKRKSS